jgi:hypothetical protein
MHTTKSQTLTKKTNTHVKKKLKTQNRDAFKTLKLYIQKIKGENGIKYMTIAQKELLQTQAFFCYILHFPNFQEHFNKQNIDLNHEWKTKVPQQQNQIKHLKNNLYFVHLWWFLHLQRVFTSTLI